MGRIIGFVDFARGWEGPVILEFSLVQPHSKTARYQAPLEHRVFDLYAPLFMLPKQESLPPRILVAVGRTLGCVRSIGFRGEDRPPRVTSDICEFDFDCEKVNSIRYYLFHEDQRYYLYVPKEVFATEDPPPRVFLQIGLPGE